MAHSEQNIIGIDKSSLIALNGANTILRTRSRAANDYRKQIFATPRYKSKHPLYPKLILLKAMHTRGQHKQVQFCSERNYNTMQINTSIVLKFLYII